MKTNSNIPSKETRISKNVRGKKTKNPGYKAGDHWVQCDRCASIIRSSDARTTWDNLVVCPDDWEVRHPQDFVRGRTDNIAASDPRRPESDNTFVVEEAAAPPVSPPDMAPVLDPEYQGLVYYYDMSSIEPDIGAGYATVPDISGNNNPLQVLESEVVLIDNANVGNSLGNNDLSTLVDIVGITPLSLTGTPWTLTTWFSTDQLEDIASYVNADQSIMKVQTSAGDTFIDIVLRANKVINEPYQFTLRSLVTISGVESAQEISAEYDNDPFHNLTAVFDGTDLRLYVDGMIYDTFQNVTDFGSIVSTSMFNALPSRRFLVIGKTRLFNEALSQENISVLVRELKPDTPYPFFDFVEALGSKNQTFQELGPNRYTYIGDAGWRICAQSISRAALAGEVIQIEFIVNSFSGLIALGITDTITPGDVPPGFPGNVDKWSCALRGTGQLWAKVDGVAQPEIDLGAISAGSVVTLSVDPVLEEITLAHSLGGSTTLLDWRAPSLFIVIGGLNSGQTADFDLNVTYPNFA